MEQRDAQVTLANKADDQLRHNEEVGGMIYKYDLPVENMPITFRNAKALALAKEEESTTPTMRLMEELECDKDTAFESFIIKHHSTFNNEVDMYGDIQQAGDSQLKVSTRPHHLNLLPSVFELNELTDLRCFARCLNSESPSRSSSLPTKKA